jgi:hypothetical protein
MRLRHLLCPANTCSTPRQGTRLWDSLLLPYCCQALITNIGGFSFVRVLQAKERADERTRTADLLITILLARGTHPKYVWYRARNASIQPTLDRYSHWMPSMGRNTAEGIDEALG